MNNSNPFFDHPILNSPYGYPERHWELDDQGQPTQKVIEHRRAAEFITPIPKPKKRKGKQTSLVFDEGLGLSTASQQYNHTAIINSVRNQVDKWRRVPNPNDWHVTSETARLLEHWRHHNFSGIRPFFCQVEAVETAIWLTEVAPQVGKAGEGFLEHLANANNDANPELMRLALKLATGAGQTTVMAMLIAWQAINAARHPQSKKFTRGFLVVAPGLTIKDRLRVLQPNDPDSYYKSRELVPGDMLDEVNRAKIVITNYHAFKLRERIDLSKGGRSLLQGRGEELNTLETEGQRGTTPFRGEKNTNWEGGYRVPFVMRWPGVIKPGTIINDICAHEDWATTLMAAAGEPDVKQKLLTGYLSNGRTFKVHLDGYNLTDLLAGKDPGLRKEFFYWTDDGELAGLRYQKWKLVFLEQREHGFSVWGNPFIPLRVPLIEDLHADPYERASYEASDYDHWMIDRVYLLVPAQAFVGQFLMTFKDFPPRQKAASFSLDQVMQKLQEGIRENN
jgi:hypothetical protein